MIPVAKINLIDFVVWLALKDWELDAQYPVPRESFEYYEYLVHCSSNQLVGSKSERIRMVEESIKETWLWKIHCFISKPWYKIDRRLHRYK